LKQADRLPTRFKTGYGGKLKKVGFLHADDVYASADVLAHVAEAFADPAVCAVYGDLQYVRQDDLSQVVRH